MDEKVINYKKTCFKNSERIFKTFFDIVLLEICDSFELLAQEKLFNLTDTFWCDIKYVEVDVTWLMKAKSHLTKLERTQSKIKQKKLRKISTNSLHKKLVLERFDEYLPFFKFKYDFNAFCYFKSSDFENIYPLFIIKKVSSTFKSSSSSQASQAKPVICDFVKPEEEENKIINSAENTPDIDEKHEKENFNNKTTFKMNLSVAILLIFQEEIFLKLESCSCLRV